MLKVFFQSTVINKVFLTSQSSLVLTCLRDYSKQSDREVKGTMNEAFLRYDEGNEAFDIFFKYVNPTMGINKEFMFTRQVNSPVESLVSRINSKMMNYINKKNTRKAKRGQAVDEIADDKLLKSIFFLKDDTRIDNTSSCECLLKDSTGLKLVIQEDVFKIRRNVPWIKALALPTSILAGFPNHPAKFQGLHVDVKESKYFWYKNQMPDKPDKWQLVGENYIYTPSTSDIGCKLKLQCVPRNARESGIPVDTESPNQVEAGPGPCPFEMRHNFTRTKLTGKSFRMVSYNILADTYAHSDFSKDILYPYCPPYALAIEYRKQLVLKELIGYNSDVICLQEVDSSAYDSDLMPALSTLNYDAVYNAKKQTREGLATFYDRTRFEQINYQHCHVVDETDVGMFKEVWEKITNDKAKERFLNRNTVVQVTCLRSKENLSEILVLGNTHLYFKPDADHIRLLQAFYVLTYTQQVAQEVKKQYPDCNVSVCLCGDFNSTPECGVYRLMTENYVAEDCEDWRSNSEEVIENLCLFHDLQLSSACGTPEYTNYTPDFSGCLDYIFYQTDRLQVEQVIPMPSKEELVEFKGLPSVVFPSDHISLCADLRWTVK